MDVDDGHPNSTYSPASVPVPSTAAHDDTQEDDLSDSELSQLQAEIERSLSSASPETSLPIRSNENVFDEVIEVDSDEEIKRISESKSRKRVTTKEYYDPELFGLRRSVCLFFPSAMFAKGAFRGERD
jgi:hypothetical protein